MPFHWLKLQPAIVPRPLLVVGCHTLAYLSNLPVIMVIHLPQSTGRNFTRCLE